MARRASAIVSFRLPDGHAGILEGIEGARDDGQGRALELLHRGAHRAAARADRAGAARAGSSSPICAWSARRWRIVLPRSHLGGRRGRPSGGGRNDDRAAADPPAPLRAAGVHAEPGRGLLHLLLPADLPRDLQRDLRATSRSTSRAAGRNTSTFYIPAIAAFSVINACYTGLAMSISFARDQGQLTAHRRDAAAEGRVPRREGALHDADRDPAGDRRDRVRPGLLRRRRAERHHARVPALARGGRGRIRRARPSRRPRSSPTPRPRRPSSTRSSCRCSSSRTSSYRCARTRRSGSAWPATSFPSSTSRSRSRRRSTRSRMAPAYGSGTSR